MSIELKIPAVGESIVEVEIGEWLRNEGDFVQKDENVVTIETEKATVELPAPSSGKLTRILKKKGEKASVEEVIGLLEVGEQLPLATQDSVAEKKDAASEKPKVIQEPQQHPSTQERHVMPAARQMIGEHQISTEKISGTGPGGRVLKEDVLRSMETRAKGEERPSTKVSPSPEPVARNEQVVPMSSLRRHLAKRLVEAQHTAALLTTFNEIDMSTVQELRKQYGEAFQKKYEVKLGFMSFFVKAAIDALRAIPQVNAELRDDNLIYRNYYDIGVAISSNKGLVVPVLRHAERMSFAEVEKAISDLAARSRENKITLEELKGGTFTITNGGIFGSLLSTPLVNPPQSAILGMHAIQDRPVARENQVVIRPMMYVALTYDHRVIDGREAVTFLRRIKEAIEQPSRMLIEV